MPEQTAFVAPLIVACPSSLYKLICAPLLLACVATRRTVWPVSRSRAKEFLCKHRVTYSTVENDDTKCEF